MRQRLRPTLLIAGSALMVFVVAPWASASAALACDQNHSGDRHHRHHGDNPGTHGDNPDNSQATYSHSRNAHSHDSSSNSTNSENGKPVTGGGQTVKAYVTSYGYNDNDDGAGHYGTAAMAYPKMHNKPTEGSGTYDDPVTFATDEHEIAPGTRIYVPFLQKYFIMEDGCTECSNDAQNGKKHVDLWMGPASSQPEPALDNCEGSITKTADIIVNPDPGEAVDKTPMFSGGKCTAAQH